MIHLPFKIGLYVPNTDYEAIISSADYQTRIDDTRILLASWFGGTTTLNYGHGSWLSDDGLLINDQIAIVYSAMDHDSLTEYIVPLFSYVLRSFITWQQYTIALEVNDHFFIIDPDDNINDLLAYLPSFKASYEASLPHGLLID